MNIIMSRLKEKYIKEIAPSLMADFKYFSVMQAPKVEKVVINAGTGKIAKEKAKMDTLERQISFITGQKPIATKARKSVAGFKIRAGMPIGLKATLRGERMYEFLDRLISIALPRTRDFSGISLGVFDGKGNASIGIKDSLIFPELSGADANENFSIEITIATTGRTDDEAKKLLTYLGFPFKKSK